MGSGGALGSSISSVGKDLFQKKQSCLRFFRDFRFFEHNNLASHLHFKCNLNDREVPNLLELLSLLERVNICSYFQDRRIWLGDASEVFSCKSAFSRLIDDESIQVFFPVTILWELPIPPKVKEYLLGYY